jgi:hypothetical protein
MKKVQPTKDHKKQLAALDAIRDTGIGVSDIPEQGSKSGLGAGAHVSSGHAGNLDPAARAGHSLSSATCGQEGSALSDIH